MSYNLGTAEGTIALNYTGGNAAKKAKDDVDGIGKSSVSTSEALHKVGNVTGVAGAAIAAGIGLAAKSAADFETRMSAVKAVSGASQKEMDQLSKKALQLGKDTSFSATEAASAIEELVKAGVSIPDVMNGAADATVALAAAGGVSLPEAATIASNAMNQFGLAAQDMPHIADLIAGAANASAIDVKQFGYSLSQAGAVANLVGASFEDTAAAIALMGNAGIVGSDAGTSLKTMLSNLQPSTKKQITLMKELGLMTKDGANQFFTAEGKLKSFADIAGLLNTSLKDATAAQRTAALETIFGSDAIRAAAIFTQQGAKGFNDMAAAMTKVKAADVAKTRLDNFNGSLEALKGSLETAAIVIGQIVLPALRKLVDFISGVVNAFLELPAGVQKAILIFVAIVGALLLVTAAIVKVSLAVKTAIPIIKALGLAMKASFLTNPVFLIIAAIVLLVVAIVVLWKRSETFRNIVKGVWSAIQTAIKAVVDWLVNTAWPAIQNVWNGIVTGLKAVGSFFVMIWNAIKTAVSAAVSFIATVITTYVNIWKAIISAVLGVIMGIWKTFWGIFGGVITAAFNLIVQIIKLGVAIWQLIIGTATKAILKVVTVVWNAISSFLKTIWNAIKAVATVVWNGIKNYFVGVFNTIKSITTTVWNAVRSAVITAINAVKGPVTSAVNAVKTALTAAWNAVRSATSTVWNALAGIVGPAINKVLGIVTTVQNKIANVFKGAGKWLYNAGRDIIQGLLNGLESLMNAVTSKLKWLTDHIPKVKGPESKDKALLRPAGKWIMEGFIDELDKGIIASLMKLSDATDMIPNAITTRSVAEVMPATGLPTRIVTPKNPNQQQVPVAGPTINLEVNNPVGKPAVEEFSEAATRLAVLGVF